MKQPKDIIVFALFVALIFCQITDQTHASPSANSLVDKSNKTLSFLQTEGDRIIDKNGEEVRLRGVNIGCWLLIEPWILGDDWEKKFDTEMDIWNFTKLGNESKPDPKLIRTFRDNWFTANDAKNIADAGMNCVRLPIWWRATNESDSYDGSFNYVNRCIEWCNINGLYVILDLHGAPGGQNNESKNLGERRNPKNDLWNSSERQDQFIEWWESVANLYKDNPTVAAYDLLNEGDPQNFNDMIELYNKTYYRIREIDPNHIIILEAGIQSQDLYLMPIPKERGWTNVIYSFNYYPWGPDNGTKALNVTFPCMRRKAVALGVPIYVGEFNVMERNVSPSENYTDIFKNYTDAFDSYGWSWTFWTYKKIETKDSPIWGLYGYVDADKAPMADFHEYNYKTIEAAFKNMNTNYTTKQVNPNNLSNVLKLNLSKALKLNLSNMLTSDRCDIDLNPCNFHQFQPNSSIRPEWYSDLPALGTWESGGKADWRVKLDKRGCYSVSVEYATPHNDTTFILQIDDDEVLNRTLSRTGKCNWNSPSKECEWQNYTKENMSEVNISNGEHNISVIWKMDPSESNSTENTRTGNLRRVMFINQSCKRP